MRILTPDQPFTGLDAFCRYGGKDACTTVGLSGIHDQKGDDGSRFVEALEMAVLEPYIIMGMRGWRTDEDRARERVGEAQAEIDILKEEAEVLVKALDGWPSFNLSSDTQLKAVLYGPINPPVCEKCGWTGVEVTQEYQEIPRVGKRGQPLKPKILQRRTRKCPERHTYPGLGLSPYHDRKTGNLSTSEENLEKLIAREERGLADGEPAQVYESDELDRDRYRALYGISSAGWRRMWRKRIGLRITQLRLSSVALEKEIQFLTAPRMPNGRYAFMIEPGTGTLRTHSNMNSFGEGWNIQNLTRPGKGRPGPRSIFLANPGYSLWSFDLSAAESYTLAHITMDPTYIDMHDRGDPHSGLAVIGYDEIEWGDDWEANRRLAEDTIWRMGWSVRTLYKHLHHGITRFQTEHGAARLLRIKPDRAKEIIDRMMSGIPVTREWMRRFREALSYYTEVHVGGYTDFGSSLYCEKGDYGTGPRVTVHLGPYYYSRRFHTHPRDDKTARDAISFILQSIVRVVLWVGLLRVWQKWDHRTPETGVGVLEVLTDKHDELIGQVQDGRGDLMEDIQSLLHVPIPINGKVMTIPVDGKLGKHRWSEL